MTADAKVGLLLGLFFIVVIAFLINGLPNFIEQTAKEENATTALVVPSAPDLVIDRRIAETAQQLTPGIPLRVTEPPQTVVVLDQPLPQTQPQAPALPVIAETPVVPQPVMPEPVTETVVSLPPVVPAAPVAPVAVKSSAAPIQGKTHVVQKGETLAVIAKKYYGPEEGNRRAVIQKLYEANKDILASPDKVTAGNTLVIPSQAGAKPAAKPASESLLKKFTNLFEKSADQPKALRPVPAPAPATAARTIKTKDYVVQPGDNLWKIAEKTMGDGKQFNKLMELNKGQLKSADDLVVGMKLSIPAR